MRRRKFSSTERFIVTKRANYRCEYCQTPLDFSPESFEIEHIIPVAKEGTNELENLALSCGGCNGRKSDKTTDIDPMTGKTVRLFNPRIDRWKDHFVWSPDFFIIESITPIGRATVQFLRLNRKGLINLRKALFHFGVHPPKD